MEDRMKNAFVYSFFCKDSYLKDLMILNVKSLVDDKNEKVVFIDYSRLKEELVFYQYYGEKQNTPYILNLILPIILSNRNFKKAEEEIIKNIFSYYEKEGNIKTYEYLFAGVVYGYLIHGLIKNPKLTMEDILAQIKNYIMEFNLERKDVIPFEKIRIYFMQKLDRLLRGDLNKIKEENIIDRFLRLLYQIYIEDEEEKEEGLKSIKNAILGIIGFKIEDKDIKNIEFIKSLSNYILKLRGYEIGKKTYTEKTSPKDLISLNVGDTVYNPILNNIKVIDKKIEKDILYMKVQSKSGEYIFRFKKKI